eukprot:m.852322 g.852322  ORF g.852322 m.852322 type:complete len:915 (-) comp23495_c0_seq1:408-3152(-)
MSGNRKDPSVASDWKVGGTKKGALPIRVEKRGHKTVTVVYNVLQRPDMLLYDLKRSIGTGGKLCGPGIIEIQGDQQKKIEAHLLDCPRKLQGIAGLGARKQETTHSQAKKDDDGSGATGQRRRDKPRWDRRDKESERRFVSMRCGCNWIYCSGGDNCRAIANTSQISGDTGESMMWGLEDDGDLMNSQKPTRTHPVQQMSDADLNNALSLFGLLSEKATVDKKTGKNKNSGSTASKQPRVAAPPKVHARNTNHVFWQRPRDVSSTYGAVVRSSHRPNRQPRRVGTESTSHVSSHRVNRSTATHTSRGKSGRGSGRAGRGGGKGGRDRRPRLGDVGDADPYYDDVAYSDAHANMDERPSEPSRVRDAPGDARYPVLPADTANWSDGTHQAPGLGDYRGEANHGSVQSAVDERLDPGTGGNSGDAVAMTQAYYERKFMAIIGDVLQDPDAFQWNVFFDSMGFGIPEDDSFLAALEASVHDADRDVCESESGSDYDDYDDCSDGDDAHDGSCSADVAWGRGAPVRERATHPEPYRIVSGGEDYGYRAGGDATAADMYHALPSQLLSTQHESRGDRGGGVAASTPVTALSTVPPSFLRGGAGRGRGRGSAGREGGAPGTTCTAARVPHARPVGRPPPGLSHATMAASGQPAALVDLPTMAAGGHTWQAAGSNECVSAPVAAVVPSASTVWAAPSEDRGAALWTTPDVASLHSERIRQLWSDDSAADTSRHSSGASDESTGEQEPKSESSHCVSRNSMHPRDAACVDDVGHIQDAPSDEEGLWLMPDSVVRAASQHSTVNDADVATLLDMGFAYDRAVQCLGKVHGNVEMAMELLLANADGFGSHAEVGDGATCQAGLAMKDSDYQLTSKSFRGNRKIRVPSGWRMDHGMLVDMGFDAQAALEALEAKGGSLELALEML